MTMHVKVGSAWKEVVPSVKVGSAWKTVTQAYVKVGSAWKVFYNYLTADALAVTVYDFEIGGGTAIAYASYDSDGNVYQTTISIGAWLTVGTNSDFAIWLEGTGDTPAGPALNTWHLLSTTREWSLQQSGFGNKQFFGTVKIRRVSDEVEVDSASFDLTAEVDV